MNVAHKRHRRMATTANLTPDDEALRVNGTPDGGERGMRRVSGPWFLLLLLLFIIVQGRITHVL